MSKFKVGDPVKIVPEIVRNFPAWGKEGIILEVGKRWDGVDLYVTDIPYVKHFGGTFRCTEDELELIPEPDTHEYTLEEWDSEDLLEELLRRQRLNNGGA